MHLMDCVCVYCVIVYSCVCACVFCMFGVVCVCVCGCGCVRANVHLYVYVFAWMCTCINMHSKIGVFCFSRLFLRFFLAERRSKRSSSGK